MPMNQRTTSPVPNKPGRKLNPKMTTNRSMMVPQGDQNQKIDKQRKKTKTKKKRHVNRTTTNRTPQNDFVEQNEGQQRPAPKINQQRKATNPSRTTTSQSVNTQQLANTIYHNLGKTIVEDELIESKDKQLICQTFIQDVGGATPEILDFLNNQAISSLDSSAKDIEKGLQSLNNLYNQQEEIQEEEKSNWEKQIKKVYDKTKKTIEEQIKTINDSFLPQENKYERFKNLVVLINSFPFGDLPTIVHKKFYIFTISLIKAGLFKILEEDFIPTDQ